MGATFLIYLIQTHPYFRQNNNTQRFYKKSRGCFLPKNGMSIVCMDAKKGTLLNMGQVNRKSFKYKRDR